MNPTPCTVTGCLAAPATNQPSPLCTRHGVETALAVLPLALADTLAVLAGENNEAPDGLADLQGRVGRHWRQGQINAVLSTAQRLYAEQTA